MVRRTANNWRMLGGSETNYGTKYVRRHSKHSMWYAKTNTQSDAKSDAQSNTDANPQSDAKSNTGANPQSDAGATNAGANANLCRWQVSGR